MVRDHDGGGLLIELHASLVVVAATASAIEALLGDVRYLVPPIAERKRRSVRKAVRAIWSAAFGPSAEELDRLSDGVSWLSELRNLALHAETESLPAKPHPAGLNSGLEHHVFNAVNAKRAVDTAKTALVMSAAPRPTELDDERRHWIMRWSIDRSAYHRMVVEADSRRSSVAEPSPVHPEWD